MEQKASGIFEDLIRRMYDQRDNDLKVIKEEMVAIKKDIQDIRISMAESKVKVSLIWAIFGVMGAGIATMLFKIFKIGVTP